MIWNRRSKKINNFYICSVLVRLAFSDWLYPNLARTFSPLCFTECAHDLLYYMQIKCGRIGWWVYGYQEGEGTGGLERNAATFVCG